MLRIEPSKPPTMRSLSIITCSLPLLVLGVDADARLLAARLLVRSVPGSTGLAWWLASAQRPALGRLAQRFVHALRIPAGALLLRAEPKWRSIIAWKVSPDHDHGTLVAATVNRWITTS
jgi:hypothetical protein